MSHFLYRIASLFFGKPITFIFAVEHSFAEYEYSIECTTAKNLQNYIGWVWAFSDFLSCRKNLISGRDMRSITMRSTWKRWLLSFLGSFFLWLFFITRSAQENIAGLKADNLQYSTLGCWIDGTSDSSAKGLMFQALFFFIVSSWLRALKILYFHFF